jgi:hypothetical protein
VTDDDIRALVRAAIQKHLGTPGAVPIPGPPAAAPAMPLSFGRYTLPRADDDTMCLIEPAVRCNHCGYCQCHGH